MRFWPFCATASGPSSLVPSLLRLLFLLAVLGGSLLFLLPLRPSQKLPGTPIWAIESAEEGNVALFRYRFKTTEAISQVSFNLFADTRYEAWVDNTWVGRGPARFSHVRQEFDRLPVADLAPGEHILAVLVQSAPNQRRSEALRAGLQGNLQGLTKAGQGVTLAKTGRAWKAKVTAAWNPKARQIHAWNLIGPQELLDLRKLPATWTALNYDDHAWWPAKTLPPWTFPQLLPRTIPLLHFLPREPLACVEAGLLSPTQQIIDLDGPGGGKSQLVQIPFTATKKLRFVIEATTALPAQIDAGRSLTWGVVGAAKQPDLLRSEQTIEAGPHYLSLQVPSNGAALAVPKKDVQLAYALVQGSDAGRRMLLGNPVAGSSKAPKVSLHEGKATALIPASDRPRYFLLDFGRTVHARPELLAEGPAGTIIEVGWDERLTAGRALPAPGSLHKDLWRQVDSWVLDGTARRLTTLDTRAGRYMLVLIWGKGEVKLSNIQALEETYVAALPGSFTSSDPLLDQIWQVGATTLIPNMTDAYADPWRERGEWWGDTFVAFHVNEVAVGDQALFKRGLRMLGETQGRDGRVAPVAPHNAQPTLLLDYALLWVEGLHHYWQLTGDLKLVKELFPKAQRLMTYLRTYENRSGLLYLPPERAWSQAALIDWSASSSRNGESTALNALYAASLGKMGELSEALGGNGATYERHSWQVKATLQARLYLPTLKTFASSRFGANLIWPTAQAQAWALVYDLVPAAKRAEVTEELLKQLQPFWENGVPKVEIYGLFWVLEALGQNGRGEEALQLIRENYGQLLAQGATTWWETFTSNQRLDSSLSHAWGGSPTWFLTTYVLGARQTGPGTWQVAPQPSGLQRAAGVLPLPEGPLAVSWQVFTSCHQMQLTIVAPPKTKGSLLLPLAFASSQVLLNGQVVWPHLGNSAEGSAQLTGAGLTVGLGEGRATIEVKGGERCKK